MALPIIGETPWAQKILDFLNLEHNSDGSHNAHTINRVITYQVENLGVGSDIGDGTVANARTFFIAPNALTLTKVSIIAQDAHAGIDASNIVVIQVFKETSLVVTQTFNAVTIFPAIHVQSDLGALSNTTVTAGQDLRFDVMCGATVNLPSFILQVEYTSLL
jgi:hypothetical protein